MTKTALITGVSGQDGAYLCRFLLQRGYRVIGQIRPGDAALKLNRLIELGVADDIEYVEWSLQHIDEITTELNRLQPDEIYNLAGTSSVASSFDLPLKAFDTNAGAAARLLEAARLSCPSLRFFQASTSEMFGAAVTSPQDESTPFRPRSPYAVAKLFSHWQTTAYREAYGFFGACGIMFNHESPLRGRQFVTRKITAGLTEVKHGQRHRLTLGNLDVQRDWGFAADYVEGMWRILQQRVPADYVLATGVATPLRRFVELAADSLRTQIDWSGSGPSEVGIDRKTGRIIVEIDPSLLRPAELMTTVGDAGRARRELGWSPKVDLPTLVATMVAADERRLVDNRLDLDPGAI